MSHNLGKKITYYSHLAILAILNNYGNDKRGSIIRLRISFMYISLGILAKIEIQFSFSSFLSKFGCERITCFVLFIFLTVLDLLAPVSFPFKLRLPNFYHRCLLTFWVIFWLFKNIFQNFGHFWQKSYYNETKILLTSSKLNESSWNFHQWCLLTFWVID